MCNHSQSVYRYVNGHGGSSCFCPFYFGVYLRQQHYIIECLDCNTILIVVWHDGLVNSASTLFLSPFNFKNSTPPTLKTGIYYILSPISL